MAASTEEIKSYLAVERRNGPGIAGSTFPIRGNYIFTSEWIGGFRVIRTLNNGVQHDSMLKIAGMCSASTDNSKGLPPCEISIYADSALRELCGFPQNPHPAAEADNNWNRIAKASMPSLSSLPAFGGVQTQRADLPSVIQPPAPAPTPAPSQGGVDYDADFPAEWRSGGGAASGVAPANKKEALIQHVLAVGQGVISIKGHNVRHVVNAAEIQWDEIPKIHANLASDPNARLYSGFLLAWIQKAKDLGPGAWLPGNGGGLLDDTQNSHRSLMDPSVGQTWSEMGTVLMRALVKSRGVAISIVNAG